MSDDNGVTTSADVAPKRQPKSFKDLNKDQLVLAALAFGADETATMKEIRDELEETGVTWEMYAKHFKLEGYENAPEEVKKFEMPEPADAEEWPDEDDGGEEVSDEVKTVAPEVQLAPAQKYLIKMTRENPYFEFGKYKFTQENPYAIMTADDAQRILESEQGFRQAYPAELQEFYN